MVQDDSQIAASFETYSNISVTASLAACLTTQKYSQKWNWKHISEQKQISTINHNGKPVKAKS